MNRKRLHTGCRIFVQLILVTSLLTVTFVQFLKLKKETTNVGISYNDGKQDLEFPSITFCPVIWKNRPENVTFEDYMKHALNFSNFFESAWQNTYMPGGRNFSQVDLLENNTLWRNSYYVLLFSTMIPCVTLDPPIKTISQPFHSYVEFILNITEIGIKLSEEWVDKIYIELHSKGQSRMNQGYSLHDLYSIKNSTMEEYFMEPTLQTKMKTKNYNCNEEEKYVEPTDCLNNFYMSKLNCTFPWLESTIQIQEKCGSKHFIKDLIDLIDDVSTGYNLPHEVEECLIPNCLTTTWNIRRKDTSFGGYLGSTARLLFVFDSSQQFEIISDTMDYTIIDLLSDFGGYLGLFIGASVLYLYDISTHFILQIITKFKSSRLRNNHILIEEFKTEYDVEGQDKATKMNENFFKSQKAQ